MKNVFNFILALSLSKSLIASPVKIGLVGMGLHMSDKLIPALQFLKSKELVELSYAVRNNQEALVEQQELYGITEIGNSYQEMLDASAIQAVIVSGPPSLHEAVVKAAIQKNIPVFCEKPLSFSFQEAQSLTALAELTPQRVQAVGFNFIFMPKLLEYQKKNSIKKIDMVSTMGEFFGDFNCFDQAFANALYYVMIHPLSVLIDCMEESPDDVKVHLERKADNEFQFTLKVEALYGDQVCTLKFRNYDPKGFSFITQLTNEEGKVYTLDAKRSGEKSTQKSLSYTEELAHFLQSVITKKAPKNDFSFNLKVQELAHKIFVKVMEQYISQL